MYPQLLIIDQYDIEYSQYPIEHLLVQNVIVVKCKLVAIIDKMLNEVALFKDRCHLIDLLWRKRCEKLL